MAAPRHTVRYQTLHQTLGHISQARITHQKSTGRIVHRPIQAQAGKSTRLRLGPGEATYTPPANQHPEGTGLAVSVSVPELRQPLLAHTGSASTSKGNGGSRAGRITGAASG